MKPLSAPQRRALEAARDFGEPTRGLSGRSEWGGWTRTRAALLKAGFIDRESRITELGRRRLASELGGSGPKPETPGPKP